MAKGKCIILDGVKDNVVHYTTYCREEHDKGDVGYLDDIVSRHFRATKDAIGESTAVVSDVEGGADRSIPPQIIGDLAPTYFHRAHTG